VKKEKDEEVKPEVKPVIVKDEEGNDVKPMLG